MISVPFWRRVELSGAPRRDTEACDVLVIGAGVCGLSATLALERAKVDVRCIDAQGVGAGASTKNAGYLMRGAADNYAVAVREWGREAARALWTLTEDNLRALLDEGVEGLASFRWASSCLAAADDAEAAEVREAHTLLVEDGLASELIEDESDALFRGGARPPVGLVNPKDATVNPAELIAHLAGRLATPVLVEMPAYAIEEDGDGVTVRTAKLDVRCQRVLVCTNAYTRTLLPELAGAIEPNRGQMLALRVPDDAPQPMLRHAYYLDRGSEYIRQADAGHIVMGGCRKRFEADERTMSPEPTPALQAELEREAERLLGVRLAVVARWAGTMGFSVTGRPIVGVVPGRERVWVCAGFTGHGMSMATRTAHLTVAAMLGGGGGEGDGGGLGWLTSPRAAVEAGMRGQGGVLSGRGG